ncbi:PhzF family phenazine biosynthesis protein [Litoreibacter ponti]|uniref:PhzF family phenazine biosynthesis protein n=1 Tax=Litoreibacter ponti TaxID=1510457 RepID=A0A2T6BF73_9RHOB|nr:PhzF family phenazine biosynthesis protein [Litoreibacter ponti]PTX54713.1 PhzF family phenazine biosynthesis protein [Litoreibacter ponti]
MEVQRLAAFAEGEAGGNPAGVVLCDVLPAEAEMQRVAAEVGYSETVFAAPQGEAWRTRYFAPEAEVPFCGHATIALGSALSAAHGAGEYALVLNDGEISVTAGADGLVSLVSPPTSFETVADEVLDEGLALFGWDRTNLSDEIAPAVVRAGSAQFLVLPLAKAEDLRDMAYDFDDGAAFMREHGFITLHLYWRAASDLVHVRNPFAGHGVYEDPATGASASAVAGYLRDAGGRGGPYTALQGVEMGAPSRLEIAALEGAGAPVRVSGRTRVIADAPPST